MQGPPDARSAGYHGYWVTDFTQIDPHFGTNEQLKQLIDAAHARGIKVFFDIITNHTADVIAYEENRYTYVPKDTEPFRTATGTPFDDRDYAGTNTFPALDAQASFPLTPYVPQGIESKTPAWLNDLTLYHNRGDTTFTGEDSLYGDFFGLDDLFTEHPRVVDGMIDIYETWVRDMRIDGFRIDTMKHVNDEFWQKFSPAVLQYAKDVGKPDFFMFGEVADGTRPLTSHYTTHNQVQSVLDFPFQEAARAWVSKSGASKALGDFFVDDDYYTDADSNAYQLPTFLGNHDAGHIGMFLRDDNPAGTSEDELLQRDKLAHGLMYLSRGNPVVYFGDEQGYTGAGNDQAARQDLFKSVDLEYDNQGDDAGFNDNIGSPYTPVNSYNAEGNFWTGHPLYREIAQLARLAKDHPALRDGAQQHRYLGRRRRRLRLQPHPRRRPARVRRRAQQRRDGQDGRDPDLDDLGELRPDLRREHGHLAQRHAPAPDRHRPAAVGGRLPRPRDGSRQPRGPATRDRAAQAQRRGRRADGGRGRPRRRLLLRGHLPGQDRRRPVGADRHRRQRALPRLPRRLRTRAGHERLLPGGRARQRRPHARERGPQRPGGRAARRASPSPRAREPRSASPPTRSSATTWSPSSARSATARGRRSAPTTPRRSTPSPTRPTDGAVYRAVLDYGSGTVTSAEASAPPPAIVHYQRPAGDYLDWGVHVWGEAAAQPTDWTAPLQRTGADAFGAVYEVPIADPAKPLNFIVHRPSGDSVPTTREPGGNRSFVPAEHNEIWLKQGDPAVYFTPPPG